MTSIITTTQQKNWHMQTTIITMMATNKDKYTHHNYLDLLTDDDYYKPTLITNTKFDKYYVGKVENDLSVRQCLLLVVPQLPALINEHKNESNQWGIQLVLQIYFTDPNERTTHPPNLFNCSEEIRPIEKRYIYEVSSNVEEIKFDTDTNEITYQLVKALIYNYQGVKETSDNEHDLVFDFICSFSCHVYKM